MKTQAAKLPQLTAKMTRLQFHIFKTDWDVYKHITNLLNSQLHAHLYNSCDDYVQTSLVNSASNFMTYQKINYLYTILENIVTQQSNPAVHPLNFSSITQSDNKTIKDFVIHLKSSAPDCEFICPQCNWNLQDIRLKDQLIRGINNKSLQTDILAKANHLKTLEDIIEHAEAFEAALHDQSSLQQHNSTRSKNINISLTSATI